MIWTQTFGGGYRAEAGDFAMSVYWGMHKGEKWKARANGTQLEGSFETLEEAQAAAIDSLRSQLTKALAALPRKRR
jgi:hypothetical protein